MTRASADGALDLSLPAQVAWWGERGAQAWGGMGSAGGAGPTINPVSGTRHVTPPPAHILR